MISFGPFLCCVSKPALTLPNVENTGYALEFSSASQGVSISIYRRKERSRGDFSDYLLHQQDVPFSMSYAPYDAVKTEAGLFLALESLIVTLFRKHKVARPLMDFLSEFRALLPLEKTPLFPNCQARAVLKSELSERGFYLLDLFSYGRTLTCSIGWYCPQDRQNIEAAPYFSAGSIEFRPQADGTLNPGKWLKPMPGNIIGLLQDNLKKASPGPPTNSLSEEGKELALDAFKWTTLAKMSTKEAKQARVEFARNHPELLDKPSELARALRKAQLYSEMTSLGNILKHLDTIISEARG